MTLCIDYIPLRVVNDILRIDFHVATDDHTSNASNAKKKGDATRLP